jgi:arylsulfatase A-like enzyme
VITREDALLVNRRLKSAVGSALPERARRLAGNLYSRYQEFDADRTFAGRSFPEVTRSDDAPDHVVCIVVDALRADAVTRKATPCLAGLNRTTAVAPAAWTFPSVASLLTGQHPHEHGAMRQSDDPDNATGEEITLPPALPDDHATLPEYLAGSGYDTYGAFGFQMPFLAASGRFGTHELYRDADAPELLVDYLAWLGDRPDRPTFAYLHLSDLHEPVEPPESYARDHGVDLDIPDITGWDYTDTAEEADIERYRTHRRRLYDAAVEYVDDEIEAFLTQLSGRLDADPAVIVTGDHGEAFWEHAAFDAERFYDSRPAYCVGHGGTPYESIVRVPLLGQHVAFDGGPASLIDITPTVLEEVGIDIPDDMTGYPHQRNVPDDRTLLTESARYGHEKKAITIEGWKLLVSIGDDRRIGFDLPEERPAELPKDVRATLEADLPPWPEGGEAQTVSGSVQKRLEHLGYT